MTLRNINYTEAEYRAQRYANEVRKANTAAEAVHILHLISRVLQCMVLIMGTGVLLGAFVSYLSFPDLLFIPASNLVVRAMIIPASMAWFHQVFAGVILEIVCWPSCFRKLYRLQYYHRRFRLSLILQALVAAPSFLIPIYHFLNVDALPDSEHNLKTCIVMFYMLVLSSAVVSVASVAIPFYALKNPMEDSVLIYYEEILAAKLSSGFQATQRGGDDQVCEMAFNILGRSVQTKQLHHRGAMEGYRELMTYLCIGDTRGIDYVQRALEGEDPKRQEAAMNVVQFWADPYWGRLGVREVYLSKALVEKVAEKLMGPVGQVRWAAANCLGGLAKRDPEFLVDTTIVSSKLCVLHRLAELVDDSTVQSETASLAVVRALADFCNKVSTLHTSGSKPQTAVEVMKGNIPPQPHETMVLTLKRLLARAAMHRLRIHCAYLLLLLDELDGTCIPLIQAIQPRYDSYWYEPEKKMLDFFYERIYPNGHRRPHYPDDLRPLDTHSIQPPVGWVPPAEYVVQDGALEEDIIEPILPTHQGCHRLIHH